MTASEQYIAARAAFHPESRSVRMLQLTLECLARIAEDATDHPHIAASETLMACNLIAAE